MHPDPTVVRFFQYLFSTELCQFDKELFLTQLVNKCLEPLTLLHVRYKLNRDILVVCTSRPLLLCDNLLMIQNSGPFKPSCVKSYFAVFQHPVVLPGSQIKRGQEYTTPYSCEHIL